MSGSSESDAFNHTGCDSDGEGSVASSYGSEVQNCRKRPSQPQIQGNAWVLNCRIFTDDFHANADWAATGPDGDVEMETQFRE
jgi:hypothetical protein